ncbi:MAG: hypothetical protein IPH42_04405 [Bacteroidetes bacterium]|nr:hypothetical protein [Bacteroidota bacterium]
MPYTLTFYANISDLSSCKPKTVCAFISSEFLSDYTTNSILMEPSDIIHTICSDPENYFDSIGQWEKIYACFLATGEERYITIGNSFSNDYAPCLSETGGNKTAYLYIDNIAIQPLQVQTVVVDTIICKGNYSCNKRIRINSGTSKYYISIYLERWNFRSYKISIERRCLHSFNTERLCY